MPRSGRAPPGRDERWGVWGAISWPPMSPKRRHDLSRETLELFENHRLGRADRLADVDDLQARILFLDVFQLLGDLFWRADEPRAGLDRVAQGRQPGLTRPLGVGDRVDLRGRQARHEAERREHLDVLLEERRRLLDALLDAVGDVEREADAEVAAQLGVPPGAGPRLAERVHDLLVGAALRGAATDDALDVVLGHEVEGPWARADDRLPALDGQRLRARHQRDLGELVPAVGHLRRRDRVVLALVRERALVERFENEVDLFLEQLAVGVLVA